METDIFTGKDEALLPARIVYNPFDNNTEGKYLDSERVYQGVPTVEMTEGGRLYYAFYTGGVGEERGNYILLYVSRAFNSEAPILAIEPPTPDCRVFDPCLWVDPQGRLWLFYAQSYAVGTHIDGRYGVWAAVCEKPDEAAVFSAPRRLANGIMMNKPTVLKNGDWLMCAAIWHAFSSHYNSLPEEEFSNVYRSRDCGRSFELIGHSDFEKRMIDEHMIVELEGGRLMMYIRSTGGIGRAFSEDGGVSWSDNGELAHRGPNSRFCLRRLKSGNIILVYHPEGGGRSNLTVWLSTDEGESFKGGILVDGRCEVSYPDITEDGDGNIYVIYDYNRTAEKEICLAVITEADILAGKPISPAARLGILLNKATGVNPAAEKK